MTVSMRFKRQTDVTIGRLRAQAPSLIAHAINRSAASGVLVMTRAVASDMRLKVGAVKAATRLDPATTTRLVARVYAGAKRIPLIEFGARGPMPSRGKGRGVTARTPTRRYPSAFLAKVGRGGHLGVFARHGKGRSRAGLPSPSPALPIHELKGPSIAHVFTKHVAAGIARFREQLPKNLAANFKYWTSKATQSQQES